MKMMMKKITDWVLTYLLILGVAVLGGVALNVFLTFAGF